MNRLIGTIILTTMFFLLNSCNDDNNENTSKSPCENITCNSHGICKTDKNNLPYCLCENGYNNLKTPLSCEKNETECQRECRDYEICINGECKLKDGSCIDDNDCNENKICIENKCRQPSSQKITNGIYHVTGNDYLGEYEGKAQIIKVSDKFKVIHLIEYKNIKFEDLKIAQAWEGTLNNNTMETKLYLKGFITSYNNLKRKKEDPYYTICKTEINQENNKYKLDFNCESSENYNFYETWEKISDDQDELIWQNQRVEIETHPEISQNEKEIRFELYKSFHELDEVKPYINRSEFKRAMHFYVYDPTDLDYYRENPDKVRVIQKITDDISLKEAKQRRDAYSTTLTQKEKIYDSEMQTYFINEKGMYSNYNLTEQTYNPSGDGLLWTGVYVASQSMKYLKTNSDISLANLKKSLNGMITCFYITQNDSTFARTIRPHQNNAVNCSGNEEEDNGKWCIGSGEFQNTDYLMSGNNDMFKGYVVAFPWAYKALKAASGNNDLINKMKEVILRLVKNNKVAKDKKTNEFLSYLMLYMLEENYFKKQEYKAKYESFWDLFIDPWLVDNGNGAKYDYGTADWSGTHLNIQTLISSYIIFEEIGDNNKKEAISLGFKRALENMRFTNQGLFQLASSVLGQFNSPPDELKYSLWYLQSYIAPKSNISFDWSINPDFCISPYPNLPWKNDWLTQSDHRINSIRMYPNFEQNVDDYMFKSNPFSFKGSASSQKQGGADFLFAYWFARYFNVINEED